MKSRQSFKGIEVSDICHIQQFKRYGGSEHADFDD